MVIKVQKIIEWWSENIPLIDQHLCNRLRFATASRPHNGDETVWFGISAFVHCLVDGGRTM